MKFRTYITLFLAVFGSAFFLASCLNDDNKIPDNCYDGVLNNGEINIDCGGPNCEECDHCTNGVFEPDRGETWVDCGGECPVCPLCANGLQDPGETGKDCGGVCGGCELLCDDGLLNGLEIQIDCDTVPGVCVACPTCSDGLFNGNEVGIDCGGPDTSCTACCSSGNCGNGIQDGAEFYIDCGGNTCPDCDTLFSFDIGSTSYVFKKTDFASPVYDEALQTLTYTTLACYDSDEDAPPIALGSLSLVVTAPSVGWTASLGTPLEFPIPFTDATKYSLIWSDNLGNTYSSALEGGSCMFVISKYKELSISAQDDVNGCNKPVGDYRFFRGTFEGTLVTTSPTAPQPTISIEQGIFQFTFLP